MTYYHASISPIAALASRSLCVTRDLDAAVEYQYGRGGVVYEVEITGRLADASDVRAVARELHPDTTYTSAWELLEEYGDVVPALIAQGYDGVRYEDMTPDNATEHETVVVWDAARCARIVGTVDVPSDEDDDAA